MATLTLTHLGQPSVATNYRTHLVSWALIFRAWDPDATVAHLAQGIFLVMYQVVPNRQVCLVLLDSQSKLKNNCSTKYIENSVCRTLLSLSSENSRS